MRTIIRKRRRSEREVSEWLTVIDEFDSLVAERSPLEGLVSKASALTSRDAGVLDALNGRICRASHAGDVSVADINDEPADEFIAALSAMRLRARETALVTSGRHEAVAASVDDAGGRIGLAWIKGTEPWLPRDELVVERLASAAAIDAIRLRDHRATRAGLDDAALERLLSHVMSEAEASVAARRAGLRLGRDHLALAARTQLGGAMGLEALGQTVARGLEQRSIRAKATVIGASAAIVAEAGPTLNDSLVVATESLAQIGVAVQLGAGEIGGVSRLVESWRQARQALTLRPVMNPPSPVTHFRDLGVLHLLAEIPTDDLTQYPDVVRVAELEDTDRHTSDLELLETYLSNLSLRQTATQVQIHYTTVQYRLKRIERALGVELAKPTDRLRTQIAILLYRIERARSLDAG